MNTLITRKLPSSHLDLIKSWGWNYDMIEALKITRVDIMSMPQGSDVWIISSRNSLHVVKKFIHMAPKNIYCIGTWMLSQLKETALNSEIKCFDNMKALSMDVGRQNFQHLLYFCGDHHRGELEKGLKDHPIRIAKVITHESRLAFPILDKFYDVVFVFSPRSVESLMRNNRFAPTTAFACIGPTTASALHEHGVVNTFCPSSPDSKILLAEFHSSKTTSIKP